ncbi:hypothetical protein Ddye_005329 [Dipteronia dyeriana]|uniref:Uncharacterized protein n=1 Tax=Dipteronia dyeriana TaxID=168575 RepID=A0AAE0CPL4_9ROSI|nr:hypothetical protein Ddye_005329 [Dipteronia dyeriana]
MAESTVLSLGKEILIKAIVQSIPTYSMTLFHLPKGFVTNLDRLCAHFWWGSTSDNRKLYLGAWSKLCQSKDCGGMGFRDLIVFNQALLAKQCWRLIHNPMSLVARVLKQCYFSETSVLRAFGGSSCSFMWKSILWGHKIIESGDDATVADLKLPSGLWNESLIRQSFLHEDASLILSILCSSQFFADVVFWHYEKYELLRFYEDMQEGSPVDRDRAPSCCLLAGLEETVWCISLQ